MASSDEKEGGQEDGTETCPGESEVVLDLSGRRLKKLERAPINQTFATALVLDNNNLQNLSNLDSYGELERLSIATNQVVRMYWFARMYSIRILNLPNNNIVQVEGLRELHHLMHLNLSGNNIKSIEGLSHSLKLEHLNLSGNFITQITDLSMLKNLKELFLHRNRIGSLHRCNKYLNSTLIILTLSDNSILDLNELCNLSHLTTLEQFTILNNPCLDPVQLFDETGEPMGPPLDFDNRPYVINWCLNLKVLDGYKVTPKESLKAEWLYSQGKGRGFQIGEHAPLVQYLSGVCLAGGGWGGADLPDDDDKLGKILQLAKQHQHELRHSSVVNGNDNSDSSSGRGSSYHDSPASLKRSASKTASVRRNTVPPRPTNKPTPEVGHKRSNSHNPGSVTSSVKQHLDVNSHSYHVELSSTLYGGDLRTPDTPGLMTQSMDPSLLAQLSSEAHAQAAAKSTKSNPMSQSLGPEHMSVSLRTDNMTTSYSGHLPQQETKNFPSHKVDLMSQSMGSEQLKMSLGHKDVPSRPTRLFSEESNSLCEELSEGSALDGLSQFVPAPESIMSPDFKSSVSQHSRSSSMKYSSRSAKTLPLTSRSASNQNAKSIPRSSSSQRSKTAPTKSSDSSRGSPKTQHRTQSVATPPPTGNMSPRLRHSPKPTPRSTRTAVVPEVPSKVISPITPKAPSEGESDNTDSEMSVSKLQTIKSIAAERKYRERRSASNRSETNHTSSLQQHAYQPECYHRGSPQSLRNHSRGRKSSNSSGGSLDSRGSSRGPSKSRGDHGLNEVQAAVTLQRHWRGYCARNKNPKVSKIREDIRHSRAEQHIRYLSDKLRAAEAGLEKERRLRHLQLDAIRTLWREIQKLQVNRGKDGVNTPSTPMTPLTPLTPLESNKKVNVPHKNNKLYSEESVKELTQFCTSLQGQVCELQDSLTMVTQVMNAFCNLPGSQSLLSQSSSGSTKNSSKNLPPLSHSVASFTNSILTLTSSIKNDATGKATEHPRLEEKEQGSVGVAELVASVTSITSNDMSTTGQDVSTLSNDSTHQAEEGDNLSDSSHSSAGHPPQNGLLVSRAPPSGPTRPSSLPVARPHTPHNNS